MKNKSYIVGGVVLGLGFLYLLIQTKVITLTIFYSFYKLWPLILIAIGLNMILNKYKFVRPITWGLVFTIIILYGVHAQNNFNRRRQNIIMGTSGDLIIEKPNALENAQLKLYLGGLSLDLSGGKTELIKGEYINSTVRYDVEYENDTAAIIELKNRRYMDVFIQASHLISSSRSGESFAWTNLFNFNSLVGECKLNLNTDVLWDLDVNIGAVNSTLDMSELMVERLNMNAGAGNFNLIFGNNNDNTDVKISAGASNFNIIIPEDVGVKINVSGALNKIEYNNISFEEKDDYLITSNYNEASTNVDIELKMGVGRLSVAYK